MASIFGDDGVDDLFGDAENDHLERDELPGNEDDENGNEDGEGDGDGANQNDEEGNPIKVAPKQKRVVRNPRPKLSVELLAGSRGIHTIEDYFKDMKYRGKGYEKQDLDEILKRLQHWGHRMYPNYRFEDVLNNIERLGKKKPLQVYMSRYRLGLLEIARRTDEEIANDYDDDNGIGAPDLDEPYDEFDALLGEQIAISKLAPRTPAHSSHYGSYPNTPAKTNSTFGSPSFHQNHVVMSTPYGAGGSGNSSSADPKNNFLDMSDLAQPLPPSQPASPNKTQLKSEQMARIAENRRLAQERLRLKQQQKQQEALSKQTNQTIIEE